MSGVAVATIMRSISFGEIFACSIALCAALVAISLVFSSFAAIRRSLIPVRVMIQSSLVSTMRERSALVRIFSGTYLPVPMIETVRSALLERGFERGCRFIVTANLLDDMRVYLLFNRLRRHSQRVLDCQWRASAMRDDADAVHAEKRTAAVLFIVCLGFNCSNGIP